MENILKNKTTVLFDLDGTLFDSIGIWNEVDRRFVAALGERDPQSVDVQALRDASLLKHAKAKEPYREHCLELIKLYGADMTADEGIALRLKFSDELARTSVCYKDGAPEFLYYLKEHGYRLGVVTTSARSHIEIYIKENTNIMNTAPLDKIFDFIYTKEDAKEIKPSPEVYFNLFEREGVCAEECVVFEDSLVGVLAAYRAGVDVYCIEDKYSEADFAEIDKMAKARFKAFEEIKALVQTGSRS